MWIFESENLQIVDVNTAALSLYGYTKEEMLSLTIKDLRPKEDVSKLLKSLKQNIETFDDAGIWRHKKKNGQIIHVHILAHPIKVDGKRCELVVAKNVTERIETEAKYREEQRILDLLIDKLPGTFFILDKNGNLLRWNYYTEEITGYSSEEIGSMNALDFFSKDKQPIIYSTIQSALEKGYAEVEAPVQSKSGEQTQLYFKGSKVKIDGKDRILGLGLDISNLVEAQKSVLSHQKLLQAIIDQSQSIIYIKDENDRFSFVNKPFLKLFDLEREEVIGKRDAEVLDRKDVQAMHETDAKVRKTGKPLEIEETVHIDGELKTYLTTKILLKGIEEYENCVFGLSTDITERKENEELIKESLLEREVLLTEIHHRVKNNLAVVSGLLELQAMESKDGTLQSKLRDSQSRIKSIALTHEILYKQQFFSKMNFEENIRELTKSIAKTYETNVSFRLNTETVVLNINQALPCSLVVNEIITCILNHAFEEKKKKGTINLDLNERNGEVSLKISDDGKVLPKNFNLAESDSFGLQLIDIWKNQLDAQMELNTQNGTRLKMQFKKKDIKGMGSSLLHSGF